MHMCAGSVGDCRFFNKGQPLIHVARFRLRKPGDAKNHEPWIANCLKLIGQGADAVGSGGFNEEVRKLASEVLPGRTRVRGDGPPAAAKVCDRAELPSPALQMDHHLVQPQPNTAPYHQVTQALLQLKGLVLCGL